MMRGLSQLICNNYERETSYWIGASKRLNGPIPTELGLLRSLLQVDMWHNEFTGPLPTEIGLITTIQYL